MFCGKQSTPVSDAPTDLAGSKVDHVVQTGQVFESDNIRSLDGGKDNQPEVNRQSMWWCQRNGEQTNLPDKQIFTNFTRHNDPSRRSEMPNRRYEKETTHRLCR